MINQKKTDKLKKFSMLLTVNVYLTFSVKILSF